MTLSDVDKIEAARNIEQKMEPGKISREMLQCALKNNPKEFMRVLNDQKHPSYEKAKELLIKSLGEGKVSPLEQSRLPKALHSILKNTSNPQGLFEKPPAHRGPGSTPTSHPYEALGAAALIQKEVATSTGKTLKIHSTDRIDFGQKAASNYTLSTRTKGTIESDVLIQRENAFGVITESIGIDTKYSKRTTYSTTNGLTRQLNGIRNSLNDGQLDEFHFVTNAQFSSRFKQMVNDTNTELIKDWVEKSGNSEFNNDIQKISGSKNEDTSISEMVDKLDYNNNRQKINQLTEKYDIPQIGFCEKVNYQD